MKRKRLAYGFLVTVMMVCSVMHAAQQADNRQPVESLQVFTDRTVYIAGEKIMISSFIIVKNKIKEDLECKVIYHELIRPDGTRITSGKFPADQAFSGGCLEIPEDIVTGYYYLKSYTRWMRNGSTENYHYELLKIINPMSDEVIKGQEMPVPVNSEGEPADSSLIGMETGKPAYKAGEEIVVTIKPDAKFADCPGMCLSVVPRGALEPLSGNYRNIGDRASDSAGWGYLPETRGISLSGRLVEEAGEVPVANALVNLSVIGSNDVMAIRTNAAGQFFFALPPYSVNHDLFLCGEEFTGKATSIFIDNDLCSRPVFLPNPEFGISAREKELALQLAVNYQVSSAFFSDTSTIGKIEKDMGLPFYGKPDEILEMDKFIDLPTLEDYFNELVGTVNVRKIDGRKVFRFNSPRAEMLIYDPLILIDWVAVNDISKLLGLAPKAIERIELVNSPYIKGNITYGGIISFVSRKSDFAGIDLPASGTFLNYQFYKDCSDCEEKLTEGENLPDSRNTVLWIPLLMPEADGMTDVSFTAPDTPGNYMIMIRGMEKSGNTFSLTKEIEVLQNK